MSRSSANILVENTLIQNGNTNAVRAKCGVTTNCTIRDIAKTALSCVYDIWWGESVVADGFLFEKNLIDHTSYSPSAPAIEDEDDDYKYCPIVVMGRGGASLSDDYLLYDNIVIDGNKLINRCLDMSNYAIYIRAAKNVKITNNDFGELDIEDGLDVFCQGVYFNAVLNAEISGNKFSVWVQSEIMSGNYKRLITGDRYKNVYGTDVSKNGVSQIEDRL